MQARYGFFINENFPDYLGFFKVPLRNFHFTPPRVSFMRSYPFFIIPLVRISVHESADAEAAWGLC